MRSVLRGLMKADGGFQRGDMVGVNGAIWARMMQKMERKSEELLG